MITSIIVAATTNRVIGKDNDLAWRLPNDMNYFKNTTMGHYVIMGRKNHESIPHKFSPLKGRENIVITRKKKYLAEGCIVVNSIEDGIKIAKKNNEKEAFIIGGGEIYKLALEKNLVDRIYLTEIHAEIDGDTFFPKISNSWKEIKRTCYLKDEKHLYDYDFVILEKN